MKEITLLCLLAAVLCGGCCCNSDIHSDTPPPANKSQLKQGNDSYHNAVVIMNKLEEIDNRLKRIDDTPSELYYVEQDK